MEIEGSRCLDEDEMIMKYFYQDYTNLEIVAFINDIQSTLKTRLTQMNLNRRYGGNIATDDDLRD